MRCLVWGVMLASALGTAAQEPPPESDAVRTRQLWDETFLESRPQAATPTRPQRPRRPAGPAVKSSIGVTLWRLQSDSPGAREGSLASGGIDAWVANRVEIGAGFAENQKVRLSIESPAEGYLYVVDREQYADGTLGDAVLIFPTLRVRAGNNAVKPGRIVELPDAADRPPYFTLKRSRPDHVGEMLTLIITPAPLPDLQIGRRPLTLSRDHVQKWEKDWQAPVRRLELQGGADRPYTKAERDVGQSPTRLLTQDDPLPQTIFEVAARPGTPILVAVPLRIDVPPRK